MYRIVGCILVVAAGAGMGFSGSMRLSEQIRILEKGNMLDPAQHIAAQHAADDAAIYDKSIADIQQFLRVFYNLIQNCDIVQNFCT